MQLPWELPAVQAPIGPAATPQIVAAVSSAGGLGTLAASWTAPAELRRQLASLRASLTQQFCVNLVLAFDQRERLQIVLDEEVPVVSFSWGVSRELIRRAPHQVDHRRDRVDGAVCRRVGVWDPRERERRGDRATTGVRRPLVAGVNGVDR